MGDVIADEQSPFARRSVSENDVQTIAQVEALSQKMCVVVVENDEGVYAVFGPGEHVATRLRVHFPNGFQTVQVLQGGEVDKLGKFDAKTPKGQMLAQRHVEKILGGTEASDTRVKINRTIFLINAEVL